MKFVHLSVAKLVPFLRDISQGWVNHQTINLKNWTHATFNRHQWRSKKFGKWDGTTTTKRFRRRKSEGRLRVGVEREAEVWLLWGGVPHHVDLATLFFWGSSWQINFIAENLIFETLPQFRQWIRTSLLMVTVYDRWLFPLSHSLNGNAGLLQSTEQTPFSSTWVAYVITGQPHVAETATMPLLPFNESFIPILKVSEARYPRESEKINN